MLKKISFILTFFLLTANMATAQGYDWDMPKFVPLPNGDTLAIDYTGMDTIEVVDPVTEEIIMRYSKRTDISKLNNASIYRYAQVKKPARKFLRGDVQKVLNRKLRKDIEEAWNFFGHVELVINEEGNVVYSDINLYPTDLSGTTNVPVDKATSDRIRSNITRKLSALHFRPAKKDGKPVAYHAMFY